nr:CheR methyltransferase, all-alpha domain protein [uncultured bacterium]
MTDVEYEVLRTFLKARSGLALSADKRYLVESRLTPVCTRFKIESLSRLIWGIKAGRSPLVEKAVIEAMTTNETFFFRDKVPFDLFQETLRGASSSPNQLARRQPRFRWRAIGGNGARVH